MKYVFITILAIVFIAIIEVLIYSFFALCCLDLNWIPMVGGFVRFIYAIFAYIGVFTGVALSISIISNIMDD